jgi:hypothetical protein
LASVVALGFALLCGCQSDVATQFPAGLTPIEENTAPLPAPTATDEFPEVLSVVTGTDSGGSFLHAYAYVKAPIAAVWTAFKDPNVVTDRRSITSFTTTYDVEAEYDVSYRCRIVVEDVITLTFDITWRESAVAGTVDAPTRVIIAYQKTWGSSLVRRMAGTIELLEIAPDVTQIGWVQRLQATRTSPADLISWNADQYTDVVRSVRGEPLLVF